MSSDKKTETSKQEPKTKIADNLIGTDKKGALNEEELGRAAGGCTQKGRET